VRTKHWFFGQSTTLTAYFNEDGGNGEGLA